MSFIEEQLRLSRDVIVYCGLGISRSASVVIAYVMKHKNLKFPDALQFVRSKRNCVRPNAWFSKLLMKWGDDNKYGCK